MLTIISPHYRSVGCRQASCAILGGCLTLSANLVKSNAFLHFNFKTQCILNMKSLFKGNVAIVKRIMRKKCISNKKVIYSNEKLHNSGTPYIGNEYNILLTK